MADITKATDAGIDAQSAGAAPQISQLLAGEDINAVSPCYIKGSDNKVYKGDGSAADELALLAGVNAQLVKSGEPVTLFGLGTIFKLAASGLTPGVRYFISATAGEWADAATTGDTTGKLQAVSATDVRIVEAI